MGIHLIRVPSPGQGADVPIWYSIHTPHLSGRHWGMREGGVSGEGDFQSGADRALLNEGRRLVKGYRRRDPSQCEEKRGCLPKTRVLGS